MDEFELKRNKVKSVLNEKEELIYNDTLNEYKKNEFKKYNNDIYFLSKIYEYLFLNYLNFEDAKEFINEIKTYESSITNSTMQYYNPFYLLKNPKDLKNVKDKKILGWYNELKNIIDEIKEKEGIDLMEKNEFEYVKCKNCGNTENIKKRNVQLRRSDEGETIFYFCPCGSSWKKN